MSLMRIGGSPRGAGGTAGAGACASASRPPSIAVPASSDRSASCAVHHVGSLRRSQNDGEPSLEFETQPELHLAWRIGELRDLPEVRAVDGRIGRRPDLAIEQVEHLEAELEARLRDGERARKRRCSR